MTTSNGNRQKDKLFGEIQKATTFSLVFVAIGKWKVNDDEDNDILEKESFEESYRDENPREFDTKFFRDYDFTCPSSQLQ